MKNGLIAPATFLTPFVSSFDFSRSIGVLMTLVCRAVEQLFIQAYYRQ